MNANAVPTHVNVRLTDPDRAAVAMVARALAAPHRTPPTLSEAIRAALRVAAGVMTPSDNARGTTAPHV